MPLTQFSSISLFDKFYVPLNGFCLTNTQVTNQEKVCVDWFPYVISCVINRVILQTETDSEWTSESSRGHSIQIFPRPGACLICLDTVTSRIRTSLDKDVAAVLANQNGCKISDLLCAF